MALLGLKKKAWIATVFLIAAIAWFAMGRPGIPASSKDKTPRAVIPTREDLPHQEAVFSVIRPLEYSALPALLDPAVQLEVDFSKGLWTLHNFRKYNKKGEVLLDGGRYGLCAELAAYTFQKMKPLFGGRYLIEYALATEPEFFDTPQSRHIILSVADRSTHEIFFLDPSFHRYGRSKAFGRYVILATRGSLDSFENEGPDVTFKIDDTMPVTIKHDYLLLLSVESVEGALDRQNIVLALSARRRAGTSAEYIFTLRKQKGKTEAFRNDPRLTELLAPDERARLTKRLFTWAKRL